jgi:hypothetical protein
MTKREPKDFNKLISWACGHILIKIGEGKFRDGVVEVLLHAIDWGMRNSSTSARKERNVHSISNP